MNMENEFAITINNYNDYFKEDYPIKINSPNG